MQDPTKSDASMSQVQLPTDPEVLIDKIVRVFPNIDRTALDLEVRAYVAAGEEGADSSKRDAVIRKLKVLLRTTPEQILKAAGVVFDQLQDAMQKVTVRFSVDTGTDVKRFEEFAARRDTENAEHANLKAGVQETKQMVMAIAAGLGLSNPDVKPATAPVRKQSGAAQLAHTLQANVIDSLVRVNVLAAKESAAPSHLLASWLTDPVWTRDHDDFQAITVIAEIVAGQKGAQQAWAELHVARYDEKAVSDLLSRAVKMANEQDQLSDEALANVEVSYRAFADEVDAIQNMLRMLKVVNSYYGKK